MLNKSFALSLLTSLLLFLSACSSSPRIEDANVDNQFWFGAITRAGSSVSLPAGLGFSQTGNQIVAGFAFAIDTEVTPCCRLTGTLSGNDLSISETDVIGDSVLIDGTFDSAVQNFSGTLTFVLSGESTQYDLNLAFDSLLSDNVEASRASKLSIKQLHQSLNQQLSRPKKEK